MQKVTPFWLFFAVFMLLVGTILYLLPYYLYFNDSTTILQFSLGDFLQEFGIAIIIAAIIALVLERLIHESLLKIIMDGNAAIEDEVKYALGPLQNAEGILSATFRLGIEDIFLRRGDRNAVHKICREIDAQFRRRKGEIKILCVAANDYFQPLSPIGIAFQRGFRDENNMCRVKVLLLDKHSKWAKKREEYSQTATGDNIQTAEDFFLKWLRNIDGQLGLSRIEWRSYDAQPQIFLIMTDFVMFIESYPFFRQQFPRQLGGFTPMLKIRRILKDNETNESFERWEKHFNNMWNECRTDSNPPLKPEMPAQ